MKTFKVEICEELSRIVNINAESPDDALDKVNKMYKNEEIILDENDYKDVHFFI